MQETMAPGTSLGPSSFYRRPALAVILAAAGAIGSMIVAETYAPVVGPPWMQAVADLVLFSAPAIVAVLSTVLLAAHPGVLRRLFGGWRWSDVGIGLSVGLVLRALVELVAPTEGSLLAGFGAVDIARLVVLALGAAIVTPVIEECLFRGIALAALLDLSAGLGRLASGVFSVAATSAVFLALHLLPSVSFLSWGQVLAPLGVGIACGILFVITRRLAASIVAHVVFNTFGIALLLS